MQTPPPQNTTDKDVANREVGVDLIPPRPTAPKTVLHLPGNTTTVDRITTTQEASMNRSSSHTTSAVARATEKSMLPPPPVQKAAASDNTPPPRRPESFQRMTTNTLLPLSRQKSEAVGMSTSAQEGQTGHMPPPPPFFNGAPTSPQTEPPATSSAQPVHPLPPQSIHKLRPLPLRKTDAPWEAFGWKRVPSKSKSNSFSFLHVKTGLRQKR